MDTIYSGASQGAAQAVEYLKALDPAGPWTIVTIVPDVEGTSGQTFTRDALSDMAAYIEARQGTENIYYAVNEIRPDCHKKPTKADVRAIRATCADIDLTATDKAGQETELRQMLADIAALPIRPTFTILSGGGAQCIYKLARKLDPKIYAKQIENLGRGLQRALSGGSYVVDSVFNTDRIMRLPGTINLPTRTKIAKGREKKLAVLLPPETVRQTYSLDELAANIRPVAAAEAVETTDEELVPLLARIADQFQPSACAMDRVRSTASLRELWDGKLDHPDQSGSQFRWELARRLAADGTFTLEDFAGLVRVWDRATTQEGEVPARNIARDWLRATAAFPQMRVHDWFQPIDDNPFAQAPDAPRPVTNASAREKDVEARNFEPKKVFGKGVPLPPQRAWLIKPLILAGEVTIIAGTPKASKSVFTLTLAAMIAAAEPALLFGEKTPTGIRCNSGRVLFITNEDPSSEFSRRLQAIVRPHMTANVEERVGEDFRVISGADADTGLLHMVTRSSGEIIPSPEAQRVADEIRRFRPALVICDTLASMAVGSEGGENDNALMDRAVRILRGMGAEVGAATIIIHHMKKDEKPNPGDLSSIRGAGAITGAARGAFTYMELNEKYREELGFSPGRYIRLDNAGANYGERRNETHIWRIQSELVGNGNPDAEDPDELKGDEAPRLIYVGAHQLTEPHKHTRKSAPTCSAGEKTVTAKDQAERDAWADAVAEWIGPGNYRRLDKQDAIDLRKLLNERKLSKTENFTQAKKDLVRRINEGRMGDVAGQSVRWKIERTGAGKTAGQAVRLVRGVGLPDVFS